MTTRITSNEVTDLVTRIIQEVTIHHECFSIETSAIGGDAGMTAKFRTHRSDAGKVIGREGRNFKALKAIFAAISKRENFLINVMMDEPSEGELDNSNRTRGDWNAIRIETLLTDITLLMSEYPVSIEMDVSAQLTNFVVVFDHPADISQEARLSLGVIFSAIGRCYGRRCDVITN